MQRKNEIFIRVFRGIFGDSGILAACIIKIFIFLAIIDANLKDSDILLLWLSYHHSIVTKNIANTRCFKIRKVKSFLIKYKGKMKHLIEFLRGILSDSRILAACIIKFSAF